MYIKCISNWQDKVEEMQIEQQLRSCNKISFNVISLSRIVKFHSIISNAIHARIPNPAEQRKATADKPPENHTAIPHTASDERKRKDAMTASSPASLRLALNQS